MSWYEFGDNPTVGERQAMALEALEELRATGRTLKPVALEGNKIATTFWAKAWCDNLESYRDF